MGKPKAAPAQDTPAAPPLQLPQGLSETEWRGHVERSAGQDVAEAIVEDVVDAALARYHEHLLSQLAKPFTANRCADMLSAMIEVAFLPHDPGEPKFEEDPLWVAGEEPTPCPRDSWSRGTIPVRKARAVRESSAPARASLVRAVDGTADVAEVSDGVTAPVPSPDAAAAAAVVETSAPAVSGKPDAEPTPTPAPKPASGPARTRKRSSVPKSGAGTPRRSGSVGVVGPVGPVGVSGGSRPRRPSVEETIDARNKAERASLETIKEKHKTPKVSYRSSAVKVEAGGGKLKAKGMRPAPPQDSPRRPSRGSRASAPYTKTETAKKLPQVA